MTFSKELELLEQAGGGMGWMDKDASCDEMSQYELHPFFKPEIDYDYKPARREQDWVTIEQLLAHACVASEKVRNGSLGKFDAYMMVIGKWPEMFDYEDEIVLEKPSLRDFFDAIKQF